MITLLKMLMIAIFDILPNSPFQQLIDGAFDEADFLPYLNWFLPFDICGNMMLTWLNCVLVYYAFVMVKKIVLDYLLDILLQAGSTLAGGLKAITAIK